MRVLIIAPYFDKNVPGESWCTYKWVEGMCERCEATVLTTHSAGWDASASPIRAKTLVNWTHPTLKGKLARIDYELKPHYLLFYWRARRWIKKALRQGQKFDLVHQVNPVAVRYPSPVAGLGLPYVTGPHAGSLATPAGFLEECRETHWFRKLRSLDQWRIRHDPWLRRSFGGASVVVGVAPYLGEFLAPVGLRKYVMMAETGAEVLGTQPKSAPPADRPLRLLFVGRIIRTKGVIDAIRAVAIAAKECSLTLDILGAGDMTEQCQAAARDLGVADRVTLHGRKSRQEVYEWYQRSDVFLFPSFREPSGTVVFEAMGFGLPIITSTVGGPGYVVNDSCGILVEPRNPTQYANDLAGAILRLARNRQLIATLSRGALERLEDVASWEKRLDRMAALYADVLGSAQDPRAK